MGFWNLLLVQTREAKELSLESTVLLYLAIGIVVSAYGYALIRSISRKDYVNIKLMRALTKRRYQEVINLYYQNFQDPDHIQSPACAFTLIATYRILGMPEEGIKVLDRFNYKRLTMRQRWAYRSAQKYLQRDLEHLRH